MTHGLRSSTILVLTALLALAELGCSHRVTLDRRRFDSKIGVSDESASTVRVYLSKRLKVSYKVPRRGGSYVDTDIHLVGRRQLIHRIVGRNTRGKLVAIDQLAGRPLLYVTFADRCSAVTCAYGFVASEDNSRYSLALVPPLAPATFRVAARDRGRFRVLAPGYLRHLAEPTPVYRAARRRLAPLTVDLEVVEHIEPRRVRFRIDDGARPERPGAPARKLTRRPSAEE